MEKLKFESICVHELNNPLTTQPHQLPIYATSSFDFENLEQGESIFRGMKLGMFMEDMETRQWMLLLIKLQH
ncbi:MAG: hypothetical protein IPL95_02360 [Saprospiraceae bacterium]|nr:hypothetical protein [Saprospiraceae bacterium]